LALPTVSREPSRAWVGAPVPPISFLIQRVLGLEIPRLSGLEPARSRFSCRSYPLLMIGEAANDGQGKRATAWSVEVYRSLGALRIGDVSHVAQRIKIKMIMMRSPRQNSFARMLG